MSHAAGANVPGALAHLTGVYSVHELADALNVSVRSIYRWRRGQCTPNKANFEALKAEIDMRYASENARHNLTVVGAQLASAFAALETDAERERDDARAEELAASMAAAEQRRRDAEEARLAEVRALAAQHRQAERERIAAAVAAAERQPRRSAHADVDPFAIFNNSTELAVAEKAFA